MLDGAPAIFAPRYFALAHETSLLVLGVEPGSPASRAGLREGDIGVEFNDCVIATIDDLHKQLTGAQAGVSSSLTVVRSTERLKFKIVPEESQAKPERN